MIIINGKIITNDGPVIENGFVKTENGIITDVGSMKNAPQDSDVIDVKGGYVVPGFIDAHTHLGMNVECEFNNPVNPNFYAIDNVDFNDRYFDMVYNSGVCYVGISPVSRCVVGGIVSVVRTKDKQIIKRDCALKLACGENPKKAFGLTDDEIFNIVNSQKSSLPVHIHIHKDVEKITLDNPVFVHGTDAKKGTILAGPMLTDISKDEMKNLSYENLYNQYKNGAKIAITSDHPETPCNYLRLYAQLLTKEGVPFDDALKTITSTPAEILGIKAGKIKTGYFDDILVFDKHPMDFYSKLVIKY